MQEPESQPAIRQNSWLAMLACRGNHLLLDTPCAAGAAIYIEERLRSMLSLALVRASPVRSRRAVTPQCQHRKMGLNVTRNPSASTLEPPDEPKY
jgi:hypothetical protein